MRIRKNKEAIRIPIALHFFASQFILIMMVLFIIYFYVQSIVANHIYTECETRLDQAVASCQNFAQAFRLQIDESGKSTEENIRAFLLNSIASAADLSNSANISLIATEDATDEYTLLWPNAQYSVSYVNTSKSVIDAVIASGGMATTNTTQALNLNGNLIYYRVIGIEYSSAEGVYEAVSDYYIIAYVNTTTYYKFMTAMTLAIIQAGLIALLAAALMSFFVTYPLLFSTRKLVKFAGRIAKSDFSPVRGHIVSKELSELADTMNNMASKLNEADLEQKTFFQNASHELRTPLMSIQGYAEGIKFGVFEDEVAKNDAIDVIIAETGRLSNLVENLLSISKMDMSRSGGYEVKKQNIDATKLCETVIDRVRGNFIHNDKSIINKIHADGLYINVNENDMLRCLENIFSNCLRYCNKVVTFECKPDLLGKYLNFIISDDGPGISPEVQEHLFERFSKGNDGKHGIGLALAMAIAEEHGGSIKAKNLPKSGACFTVSIPLIKPKESLSKINKEDR
ncbi:MAG: HAMP domain-containing histidine kinase [Saccharofermentans sp.]|nr:HAMP domain-containing histidine kinase [Saccharofermentans sp.]